MYENVDAWAQRLVGTTVGRRYQLDSLLGVGGMGAVYAATHQQMHRQVAVKVLLPYFARDESAVKRFQREAKTAATAAGRGVPQILDLDVDEAAGPFIVMEHLAGETLADRITRSGTLPADQAVKHVCDLLEVLGPVHDKGILHRDLKPANIYLAKTENGEELKVLDFGVARMFGQEAATLQLTQPGTSLGTPAYMAPEQLRGDPGIDHRADLYATAVVLYECLAGCHPYPQASVQALVAAVVSGMATPLIQLRPDLPRGLYDVVERALAQDPTQRYGSAAELRSALAEAVGTAARTGAPPAPAVGAALPATMASASVSGAAVSGVPSTAAPHKPPGGVPWLWVIAGTLVLAGVVGLTTAVVVLATRNGETTPQWSTPNLPQAGREAVASGEYVILGDPLEFPRPDAVAVSAGTSAPRPSANHPLENELSAALGRARAHEQGGDVDAALRELRWVKEQVEMQRVQSGSRAAQIAAEAMILTGDIRSRRLVPSAGIEDVASGSAVVTGWVDPEIATSTAYSDASSLVVEQMPCFLSKMATVQITVVQMYRQTPVRNEPAVRDWWMTMVRQNERTRLDAAIRLYGTAIDTGQSLGSGACVDEARQLMERAQTIRRGLPP